jgi:hypothetical protein
MLSPVELSMSRSVQFASFQPRRGVGRVLALAFLVCAASMHVLHAQNSLPASANSAAPQSGSVQWSRSMIDPFEPGPNFGNFAGSFGGGFGIGKHGGSPAVLFQMGGEFTRAVGNGAIAAFSAVPSLNQLMRGNPGMRPNPSSGAFRLSYRNRSGPSGAGTGLDFNRMIATGMYTSPDLGNGMRFSAGSDYNGHSAAGSLKHTGPSLAIKLQF